MRDKTTITEYLRQIAESIRISKDKDSGSSLPYGTRYVTLSQNQAKALRRAADQIATLQEQLDIQTPKAALLQMAEQVRELKAELAKVKQFSPLPAPPKGASHDAR